jgi:hypothetical protein
MLMAHIGTAYGFTLPKGGLFRNFQKSGNEPHSRIRADCLPTSHISY